ncbi:hypothetical protein E4K64_30200 [Bradyrhizobium frederickii]|uniref:Uncharacterized protein n=1 Tax=Bradyrhizobium frederickii TaxID=2560054 RepID=A0A4Y9NUW3_9BRAD|nr:hypothetical protein [Bradyrhizobium frederickii]TFV70463.1 hypothetical protein E4K64_30200 [Bradyrhizobium frederickii]
MIVDEHLDLSPSIRDRLSEPSTKAAERPTELPAMGFARLDPSYAPFVRRRFCRRERNGSFPAMARPWRPHVGKLVPSGEIVLRPPAPKTR